MTRAPLCEKDKISIREYIDLRLMELEKRLDQRTALLLAANERDKVAMNERLSGMNEFRNALKDQAGQFVDRKELEIRLKPLESFVIETRARIAYTMWGIGVFFVIVQIVLRVLWAR